MRRIILAASVCLCFGTQPAMAADDLSRSPFAQKSTASFAGVGIRFRSTNKGTLQPTARLRLGVTHSYGDGASTSTAHAVHSSPLEIGFSKLGRPDFYVSGHRVADMKTRLGLAPMGVALLLGGAAASALIVGNLADKGGKDPELERPQCFLPEKELCKN